MSSFGIFLLSQSIFLAWKAKMLLWSRANGSWQSNLWIIFIFHFAISWVLAVGCSLFFGDNGEESCQGTLEYGNPLRTLSYEWVRAVNGYSRNNSLQEGPAKNLLLVAMVKWDQPINASSFHNFIPHKRYFGTKVCLLFSNWILFNLLCVNKYIHVVEKRWPHSTVFPPCMF